MSGIIAVYGLVVSVLIAGGREFQTVIVVEQSLKRLRSDTNRLLPVRRVHPLWRRAFLRIHRSGGRLRDRIRRRLGASERTCRSGYANHGVQCVRAYVYESKVFVTMVLILIFGEVLGLYGCVS